MYYRRFRVRQATKKGYDIANEGDSINLEQPNSKTRRGRVGKQMANTLNTSCNQAVVQKYRIRKLTPKECWRLMGFSDEDFEKAEKVCSNTQLYKQAGNSIVVPVLEAIFNELFVDKINDIEVKGYDYKNISKMILQRLIDVYNLEEFMEYEKIEHSEMIEEIENVLIDILK